MFGSAFIPLFILIFIIIFYILYLWKQKNKRIQKENEPKKPIYSTPSSALLKEGFQGTRTSNPTLDYYINSGISKLNQSVGSGTDIYKSYGANRVHWRSQFDQPVESVPYGTWEVTDQDSYYDDYEIKEKDAMANAAMKLKDIQPVVKPLPTFGTSLGGFDADTTEIPWDSDNSSYNPSDIIWGAVSQQASRALYLKTWIENLLGDSEKFQECGNNYCYESPQFHVSTSDPSMGIIMDVAQSISEEIGQLLYTGASGFSSTVKQTSYQGKLARNKSTTANIKAQKMAHPIGRVGKITMELGPHMAAGGHRVTTKLTKRLAIKKKIKLKVKLKATQTAVMTQSSAIIGTASSLALAADAAAIASAGALAQVAVVLNAIAAFCIFFFGQLMMFLMLIEILLDPIIQALFHPGGICPPGTKQISQIIPPIALTFIVTFIPLGSFLEMFDPYVCWRNGNAYLMTPPKIPPFMADKTLSVIWHSKWILGGSPHAYTSAKLNIELDPLPSNYTWVADSDLANNPNANLLVGHASSIASGTEIATDGSPVALSKYLAVEICPKGTVSSDDGQQCVSQTYNTTVIPPTLIACTAGEYDDGFNCWKTYAGDCRGGVVQMTSGNTWDDTRGYLQVTNTTITCTGTTNITNNVTQFFKDRATCPVDYERDNGGLVCYAKCQPGFERVGAICKSTTASRKRNYMWGTHTAYYDQPYMPEQVWSLADVKVPYCDYASSAMLDKMAQFYYNNSINNPTINEDGTVTIQFITGFMGIIASSELTCDVACIIRFVTYDPITGGRYKSEDNACTASYAEDPEFSSCPFCYRRFYFIRADTDPQGEFTVTGCTFADYTAPNGMVYTADLTSNYLASLPKVWTQHDKSASIYDPGNLAREWASGNIIAAQGQGLLNMAIMIGASQAAGALTGGAGGFLSGAASMAAGVGAGLFTSMWLDQQIAGCGGSAVQSSEIINTIDTAIVGSGKNLRMVSNNNWFTVDQGPIYELAPGYTPDLKFCQNRIIGIEHCAHKYVVRDMINKYHNEHRNNHVRYVTEIEPRGKDGCYYKMKQVEYDPETNLEGTIETDTEVVLQHEIADYATCTYKSTTFASSINDVNYPIRSYPEPAPNGFGSSTGRILYPTRDTVYTSDLMARYVRIRPPISGGLLNIAHFAVFDISGLNMSVMQPTYGTSKATGAGSSDTPVSGTIDSSGSTLDSVWQPATQGSSEYWEVDLGLNILIAEVVYVSGTIPGSATTGVRIQFLYTNDPNESPIHEVALPNDKPIQYIPVYSSSYTVPSYPLGGPIKIPRPLPTKGKLLGIENGCVNTCESRKTIDNLIEQYNKMTTGSQILKVINGTTATTSKCEYLTEMVVSDSTAGSDTVV